MKYLTFFILTILIQPIFGQTVLNGFVIDSLSNDPIPFAIVSVNDDNKAVTDFDGKFKLTGIKDSSVILTVSIGCQSNNQFKVQVKNETQTIILSILPKIDTSNFIINSRPTDTAFFNNGVIQKIYYHGHDVEEFYINGQIKFKSVNGSTRSWYENGQLKNQSILKNNHSRFETEWYSDGQKKAEGSIYWGHNEKRNEGEWLKSEDWIYWNKKGERRNNR